MILLSPFFIWILIISPFCTLFILRFNISELIPVNWVNSPEISRVSALTLTSTLGVTFLQSGVVIQWDSEQIKPIAKPTNKNENLSLNLHKSKEVDYFESVRCFYPLINKVPVISEEVNFHKKDNYYQDSIFFIKKKNFISEFFNLINDKVEFENKSKMKLSNFEKNDGYNSFKNSIFKILDNN